MAYSSPKPCKSIVIKNFLGVDFTSAETETDARRSPSSVNMISNLSGRPELRTGYDLIIDTEHDIDKTQYSEHLGKVKGIHFHADKMILHSGNMYIAYVEDEVTKIYRFDNAVFVLGKNSDNSSSFFMNGCTYLLDGTRYVSYDGDVFSEVEGFIPTTSIGRKPSGGGTSLEAVNMLTMKRINSFTADGISTEYVLDGDVDITKEITAKVGGVEKQVTVNKNKVTFSEAPPEDNGIDSVVITFTATGENKRGIVEKCKICSVFGAGNPTRVFISGNSDKPATDWYSGLYDATYFPDNTYTEIGTPDTQIMGYLKQYGDQIIVKKDEDGRAGLFLRKAQTETVQLPDGSEIENSFFTVSEGLQGTGAIARGIFADAGGFPLFLSRNGLLTLTSNSVTNQQNLKNMSVHINKKLLGEKGLENACCAVFENKFALGINGNVYVAITDEVSSDGFEWFFWDNMPAQVMTGHGGKLYFASTGTDVYRTKTVRDDGMNAYSDLGEPIYAEWWSPVFDGGAPMHEKTINARGTGVIFKPDLRTSAKLFIHTDKHPILEMGEYYGDIFNFNDINFNRFTFKSGDISQVGISRQKIRNIHSFQIGVKHDGNLDSFGLLSMTINYTIGKQIKKEI